MTNEIVFLDLSAQPAPGWFHVDGKQAGPAQTTRLSMRCGTRRRTPGQPDQFTSFIVGAVNQS